ncbi:ATP-binding protein, partial [Candidatus Woesearchaeota archaeon]|nr:ATP-binding protein [Candidatus Woesearchaeota archaeon]
FELSEKYNCQIFATTHSHDCIDGFQESLKSDEHGTYFRLDSYKGKILYQFYDKESLQDVVDLNHRAT